MGEQKPEKTKKHICAGLLAHVCGQYTTARPLCTPLSRMTSRNLAVILYMPS